MKIIFIHGRAQEGKDPVRLQQIWEDAFDEGLKAAGLSRPIGLEIALPYYGDILDQLIETLEAPLVTDVVEKGAKQDDNEADFRGQLLMELAEGAGLTDQDIHQNFEGQLIEKGPLNWGWIRAILKTLDRSKIIGEKIIDQFTRDVYVYLTNKNVRRRIDSIIQPHIGGSPCVVVGHSLGSIIGYNILKGDPAQVSRYITVGSPLGIKAIKRLLESPLVSPTHAWYNARDKQDFVSLYNLNSKHFDVQPPINNYNDIDNHTDNQHGIVGYLPDRWVAKAIYEGLN